MSNADSMFDALRDPATRARYEERRQQTFESGIVKRLLRHAGRTTGWAVKEANAWAGSTDLTFEWLRHAFPRFPVELCSAKLRHIHSITLPQLLGRNFVKLPLVNEYGGWAARYDIALDQQWLAMFFNCAKAGGSGTLVLHNQPFQAHNVTSLEQQLAGETRISHIYGNPRVGYVVESFDGFLATVGTAWAAE